MPQPSSSSVEAENEAEAELESNSGAELELGDQSQCQSDAGSEAEVEGSSKSAEDSEPSAESSTQSEADEADEPSLQSEAEANKEADSQALDDSVALDESDADSAVDASSDEDSDLTAEKRPKSNRFTQVEISQKTGERAMDASSHPKKTRKDNAKPERFDANTFTTLEEHVASHNFPKHAATCGPCHFWKNRWKWSLEFCCTNPVSQKKETWLACKSGFALCLICSAMGKSRTQFGQGKGSFLRKSALKRHARCGEHTAAAQAWQQRLLAEASGIDIASSSTVALTMSASATVASDRAASATAVAVSDRTLRPSDGYRALVAVRALLETSGSFNSLDVWLDALVGDDRQALESSWHSKRLVQTMAQYEKELTRRLLREGAVFRLQADGLDRTYQIEIGTVLWTLPAFLKHLPLHGEQGGWLEVLGPRGPWIVERIIGMREFPHSMDVDGKVAMLEASVRRACAAVSGEVDTKLHQHVRTQTRVWGSDGADMKIPLAASAFFPGLVFHAWDESHSAQRLGVNAMTDGDEITITDQLLVTSKKPYSLAKFISTSSVFRKKVGDAQLADNIAFVENFGWAPQRFNSRARPYARESRRWQSIFDAVATEAHGPDKDRRILARMYLGELGGENSPRLLLGGLLADLSAEHYAWVATGDFRYPDATTALSRGDGFLSRVHTLYNEGLILTLPDTYTGATLKFLSVTSYYSVGKSVQTIGIGDWQKDASAAQIIKDAMSRMRVLVSKITEYMKFYRSKHSWLHAFTAFRLPSPLSASDEAAGSARDEVKASLVRICREADLPICQGYSELLKLLPRAEKFHLDGCKPRAAWGRAAAEWPELQSARHIVEIFLIWKTATGNLERRFRRFRELCCPQRAKLLDISVEDCMLVEQAPPSKLLRRLLPSASDVSARLPEAGRNPYLHDVLKLRAKLHGNGKTRIRQAQRRDAGISRGAASATLGPETEAAFGRKREAAIAAVTAASPSKRARIIAIAPLGLSQIVRDVAEESAQNPAAAPHDIVEKVQGSSKLRFGFVFASILALASPVF